MFVTLRQLEFNFFGALLGGLAYGFCGSYASLIYSGNINKMDAFLWAPLVFLSVCQLLRQKNLFWAVWLGFFMGLMVLGNEPQGAYYFNFLVFFFFLFSLGFQKENFREKLKTAGFYLLAIVIALIFSAQALLFYFDLSQSQVPAGTGGTSQGVWEFHTAFSLPPEEVLMFFFTSKFFGGVSGAGYWGKIPLRIHDDYLGITVLLFVILAFFSKRRRFLYFFGAAFIFSVAVAMGKYTPAYQFIYKLPLMSSGRNPIRWLLPASFFWAGLAGLGANFLDWQSLKLKKEELGKILLIVWGVFAAILIFLIILWLGKNGQISWFSQIWPGLAGQVQFFRIQKMWLAASRSTIFFGLVILCFWGLAKSNKKIFYKLCLVFIFCLVTLDLTLNLRRFVKYFNAEKYYETNKIIDCLIKDPELYRVKVIFPNKNTNYFTGALFSYYNISFYDTIISRLPANYALFFDNFKNPRLFWPFFNIKYLLSGGRLRSSDLEEKISLPEAGLYLYRIKNFLPRVYWLKRVKLAETPEVAVKTINSPDFLLEEEAVIEGKFFKKDYLNSANFGSGKILPPKVVKYQPSYVEIDVSTSPGAFLYFSDVYDAYWRAYLDGRPAAILPANYLFRAVFVPRGAKKLIFKYCPPRTGFYLTLGMYLFFGIYGLFCLVKFLGGKNKQAGKLLAQSYKL